MAVDCLQLFCGKVRATSFDRANGDLYIADVGQDSYEEVDHQPAGSKGGQNYGWNITPGSRGIGERGTGPCCSG